MLWLVAPVGAIVFVDTGGLIAYGPQLCRFGAARCQLCRSHIARHQARGSPGRTADQVRTADQPENGEALGLTVPPSLLSRADEVIE
jgi:hypothetical protein